MMIGDDFHLKSKTYSGCPKCLPFGRLPNRRKCNAKKHEIMTYRTTAILLRVGGVLPSCPRQSLPPWRWGRASSLFSKKTWIPTFAGMTGLFEKNSPIPDIIIFIKPDAPAGRWQLWHRRQQYDKKRTGLL